LGDGDRERHKLLRLVRGHAEHHALVTGAAGVDANGDIGRLLLNRNHDAAGAAIEAKLGVGVTDFIDRTPNDVCDIDIAVNRDFARYHRETAGQQGFNRNARFRILAKALVE